MHSMSTPCRDPPTKPETRPLPCPRGGGRMPGRLNVATAPATSRTPKQMWWTPSPLSQAPSDVGLVVEGLHQLYESVPDVQIGQPDSQRLQLFDMHDREAKLSDEILEGLLGVTHDERHVVETANRRH